MKTRTFAVLIITAFIMSSCIDMTEEIFLTKKGSGKYSLAMDLSGLMDMGMLADMMKDMDLGEEDPTAPQEDPVPLEDVEEDQTYIFEDQAETEETAETDAPSLFGDMEEKMDTIIRFNEIPDSIKQKISNPDILKKGYMRMQMDKEQSLMIMSFHVDFDKFSDISDFFAAFGEIKGDQATAGSILGGSDDFLKGGLFSLSKRILTRAPSPKKPAGSEGLFEGEEMEFAKMMFKGAKYTTIYHLPGKVKSTTIPNARVNGKVVTVENDMLEVMEDKVAMHGSIKFKRR